MNNIAFLMCAPEYFGVNYVINPWMAANVDKVDLAKAKKQWQGFYERLKSLAPVFLVDPQPNLPDMVFTANAGLVKEKRCMLAHFRHPERQGEEPFFKDWFIQNDFEIFELPETVFFEGEGDALFQPDAELLWMGYGFRSDKKCSEYLNHFFNVTVIPLKLVNEKFYHLDTCFFPLRNGYVMYYPEAFDRDSQQMIETQIPKQKRIVVNEADAHHFACNAVLIPDHLDAGTIVMNHASSTLSQQLHDLGYKIIIQPVNEFMRAGGANKCLTLII